MTEEPGMLQSMGSQRVRYDLETEQQRQMLQQNPNVYKTFLGLRH